jgi:hypothetical protein
VPLWRREKAGANPVSLTIFNLMCPGDGIGIRTGFRNQVLWVQVPPGAPSLGEECMKNLAVRF